MVQFWPVITHCNLKGNNCFFTTLCVHRLHEGHKSEWKGRSLILLCYTQTERWLYYILKYDGRACGSSKTTFELPCTKRKGVSWCRCWCLPGECWITVSKMNKPWQTFFSGLRAQWLKLICHICSTAQTETFGFCFIYSVFYLVLKP